MRAVNLIPAEQRRGAGGIAGRSGGIVYVLTGGLAVLVVLGVVYALAVHKVANSKSQLAALTEQVTNVTNQAQALQPYVQVANLSAEKVNEVTTIAQQRFNWPGAMRQLALALPSDVTLTTFGASSGAPNATFNLTGCASSQAEISQVLINLSQVPGVTNVALNSASETKAPGSTKTKVKTSALAAAGGCPIVTFNVALSYAGSYTVPQTTTQSGATGAQTVSTPTGTASIKTAAAQQSTGVTP